MLKEIYFGIDMSSKSFAVHAMKPDGNPCPFGQPVYSNNQPGCDEFLKLIKGTGNCNGVDRIQVGMESTSVYGWHLLYNLYNLSQEVKFNLELFLLNPKIIAHFRKAYLDIPKTDSIDAFIIADRLRFKRVPKRFKTDLKYLPLQRLTRYRLHLMKSIEREKNYFLHNLFFKLSEFNSEKVFSNTFGATALAVISNFFSTDEIVNTPIEKLCDFLIKHGKNRFNDSLNTAKELQKIARNSYRLDKTLLVPINIILASGIQNINTLKMQVNKIDKAIERELKAFPNTLKSVKGLGPVYTAGIIAEIQNISRFSNQAALAKYSTLAWSKKQSGKFTSQTTRLISSGNRYLKYYLCEAAVSLKTHNEVFRAYYQKKYSEVPKYKHKREKEEEKVPGLNI